MTNPAAASRPTSSVARLRYFLLLALHSFRRDKFLTISVVLTLGVGIAASMTTFSILHVLSGDPIPRKSTRLFQLTVSRSGLPDDAMRHMFSLPEARELIQRRAPASAVIMSQGFGSSLSSLGGPTQPMAALRLTTASFFSLFDVPFLQGAPWTAAADAIGDHVAVIDRTFADRLFGRKAALGKIINLGGKSFRVIGVLDDWRPVPRFYDLSVGAYAAADSVYVPLTSIRDLNSQVMVNFGCKDGAPSQALQNGNFAPLLGPDCSWVSVWAQLPSPQDQRQVADSLAALLQQLKKAGRASPTASSSLPNVLQALDIAHVVPGDIRAYTVLGFLFLWLCILSATGTLLGKFLRRGSEIGIRRAVGASRSDILVQFLIESGLLGAGGGILGIAIAELSLAAIRHLPTYLSGVIGMNGFLLLVTVAVAVISGILAGLLPAWRAARTDIGVILKGS